MSVQIGITIVLGIIFVVFALSWGAHSVRGKVALPKWFELLIGLVTDFFDTLGIGSFAPTTSAFKTLHVVPDQRIPGTLNVGHTLPTIVEALLFIGLGSSVTVEPLTLVLLIVAAVLGAWLGAGIVARWPRRYVQVGMGSALIVAATIFVLQNLKVLPSGGHAVELRGLLLAAGMIGNFILGAFMTVGVGLYAPAMIMVSLLGMESGAAWPIMTGACAVLMPFASWRFVKYGAFTSRAALGLALGGIPGVVLAYFFFQKLLPINDIKWLVTVVVIYAATMMLRSALIERNAERAVGAGAVVPE